MNLHSDIRSKLYLFFLKILHSFVLPFLNDYLLHHTFFYETPGILSNVLCGSENGLITHLKRLLGPKNSSYQLEVASVGRLKSESTLSNSPRLNSCYCWSRLFRKLMNALLYCAKNLHWIKKIKQNHTEQCSLSTFSQKIEKKIRNLQNSTAFLPFQHFYTRLQCTVHHCTLKTKSPTLSKSRLLSCWLVDFIKVNVAQH